jgi:NADPH:quinone reductase-like Zn-dependent oxidoreductase
MRRGRCRRGLIILRSGVISAFSIPFPFPFPE